MGHVDGFSDPSYLSCAYRPLGSSDDSTIQVNTLCIVTQVGSVRLRFSDSTEVEPTKRRPFLSVQPWLACLVSEVTRQLDTISVHVTRRLYVYH